MGFFLTDEEMEQIHLLVTQALWINPFEGGKAELRLKSAKTFLPKTNMLIGILVLVITSSI